MKSKIMPVPSRQSSKSRDWKGKEVSELKEKHKKEVEKLKKEIDTLKKLLKDETQLRIESSRSRDSEHSERVRLEEIVREQRRNTENFTNKGIFTKLEVPVSHQSSQTILEEEEDGEKKFSRISSPARSPPNEK